MSEIELKACTRCDEDKKLCCFKKRADTGKLNAWRIECCKSYKKQYDNEHIEEKREKGRIYDQVNKDKKKAYVKENAERIAVNQKIYRGKTVDKRSKYNKTYQFDNAGSIAKIKCLYRQANKEVIAEKAHEYYIGRIEEVVEYNRAYKQANKKNRNTYEKNRRDNNPAFRLKGYVSSSICDALKRAGTKKGKSCWKALPYTPEELREHIESQFEEWMNWNNQGKWNPDTWNDNDTSTWKWQTDHIIPHSDFYYDSLESKDFLACWSLSNLRPLSAKQNLLDGSRKTRHKKKE